MTLFVLFGASLPTVAEAADGTRVDLREDAWDTFLDATGDPAAAALNTAVLNHLFANLPERSWVILPDDARYATDGILRITVDGTVVTGTATILALDRAESAVFVDGDSVHISGLRVRGTATTMDLRNSSPGGAGFVIRSVGVTLSDVNVHDVASAGILTLNAVLFRITRPIVVNSQADGIHLTSTSRYGVIDDAFILSSGDDGIGIVSYADNGAPTSNITINNPVVWMDPSPPNYPYTYAWGRAYAVSGGEDIVFNNVTAMNSASAGIYIATEPPTGYDTAAVSGVRVFGGQLINSNIDRNLCAHPLTPCVDHGAVLLWSAHPGSGIDDIRIEGLTIRDTNPGASRQIAILALPNSSVSRVLVRDVTITGGPSTYFWANAEVPAAAYSTVCVRVAPSTTLTNHLGYQPIPSPGVTCGEPTG